MRVIVYPGSFDPITNGHIEIAKEALNSFDKVVMLVADNDTKKARFTTEERFEMVKEAVEGIKGIEVYMTHGLTVEFAKKIGTHYLLRGIRDDVDMSYENRYAELTHQLDKNIKFIYIKASDEFKGISSTKIDMMARSGKDISKFVPKSVEKRYQKKVA